MKRLSDMIRPFLGFVLGGLLILFYLNYVKAIYVQNEVYELFVLGIIGLLVASCYLALAILQFIFGERAPAFMGILSVVLFPSLICIEALLYTILLLRSGQTISATGWIINLTLILGVLMFVPMYIVAYFTKVKVLQRLAFLSGSILFLGLIVNLMFGYDGSTVAIGQVSLAGLVIYVLYGSILFTTLAKLNTKEE